MGQEFYRVHITRQRSGTYSVKCILSLIRDVIGQAEYRKFKVFMTERAIDRAKKDLLLFYNHQAREMIEKAQQVLKKQKRKL